MKEIKMALTIILNLILVSFCGLISKIIIVEGVGNFIKHTSLFGIGYAKYLEFFLFFIITCFLFILHRLIVLLLGKSSNFIQAISTSILGVLLFCVFAGFLVGFRVAFQLTSEKLIALIPLFIIGFILPFSETQIAALINKKKSNNGLQ